MITQLKTPPLEANFTMTPNVFFELMGEMSEAEMKVMGCAIRKIIGFHKNDPEPISISQFMTETGLCESSVRKGIKEACERGWMAKADNDGPGGTSRYVIAWDNVGVVNSTTPTESNTPDLVKSGGEGVVESADTKEREIKEKENYLNDPVVGAVVGESDDDEDIYLLQGEAELRDGSLAPQKESLDDEGLFNHPMVTYLMELFGKKTLSKAERSALRAQCWDRPEGATRNAEFGTLMENWDRTQGFQDFVKERAAQWNKSSIQTKIFADLISHLRKFGNNGKWKGWLFWKEDNKALCMTAAEKQAPRTYTRLKE